MGTVHVIYNCIILIMQTDLIQFIFISTCYVIFFTTVMYKLFQQTDNNILSYQIIDISNIDNYIKLVYKFIKLHPDMFDNKVGYRLINYKDDIFAIYSSDLHFYDCIHDVHGTIMTNYTINKSEIDFQFQIKLIENANSKSYLEKLEKYIKNQSKIGNTVDLNFYKIMNNSLITHNFYKNELSQWQTDCIDIENGYFSNHKDFIFSIMKNKLEYNINTSNSWNNMILEGVPGVGKSSLIYRIAMLLKRNIISIDLVLYLDKKKELYSIFHGNEFKLPNDDTKVYNSENCIIVLEEFDNTIEKLVELEKLYNLKMKLINNSQRTKEQNLNKQIIEQNTELDDNKLSNENYLSSQKKVIDDNRNFDNSLHSINNDINNIIQIHKEFHKKDILRLGDLLELFQGAIPVKDRIVIGTTNHFERIKTYIPELFRNGRMTPIRFDYLDWKSFTDLCKYYFNCELQCKPFEITIPTSQLIELAMKHQLTDCNINKFKEEIDSLQNKINVKPDVVETQIENKKIDVAKTEILKKLLNI